MQDTFAQMGIPFPLFEAPVVDAADYVGRHTCSLCGAADRHCFELGIGGALMVRCGTCDAENGLDADDREDTPCRSCGTTLRFPKITGPILTCHACLRAGKAAITKDTELGMISWEQAIDGVTHGVPGLKRDDFELVQTDGDWTGARLAPEVMFELLRTPNYLTIQGEQWQFCCEAPMIFVGTWSHDDFDRHAPDGEGRRLFDAVVQDTVPGLWEDELHDETGIYVFRCRHCGHHRAHWDLA